MKSRSAVDHNNKILEQHENYKKVENYEKIYE